MLLDKQDFKATIVSISEDVGKNWSSQMNMMGKSQQRNRNYESNPNGNFRAEKYSD